jgi:hypothetical protein
MIGFTPTVAFLSTVSSLQITAESAQTTSVAGQLSAAVAMSSTEILVGQSPTPVSSVPSSGIPSSLPASSTSFERISSAGALTQTLSASAAANSDASIPPVTTVDSSPDVKQNSGLNVIIAFIVLAAVGFIVAIVAWYLRTRARGRRRQLANRTAWPWSRDAWELENGDRAGSGYRQMDEKEPSICSLLPMPPGLIGRDTVMHDSHYVSMPQSPYRPIFGTTQQSVPDLAHDIGALRVANYVPGDSRATSRNGTLGGQRSTTNSSNISLDDFGMIKYPWTSSVFRPDASSVEFGMTDEKIDPYYLPGHVGSEVTKVHPPENWLSSLRSNFVSAFQAVVGATPNLASNDDHYTAEPVRASPTRQRNSDRAILKQGSGHSQDIVNSQGFTADAISFATQSARLPNVFSLRDDHSIPVPPLAIVKNRDRLEGALSRASSVYSTSSARCSVHAPTEAFGLPQIPMSRSGSMSSLQQAFRGNDREHSNVPPGPKHDQPHRPLVHSATALMSRTASSRSETMTEEELFASNILKERGKRTSDLGGAVDSVGQRPLE